MGLLFNEPATGSMISFIGKAITNGTTKKQGILTERGGSVQLTSSCFACFVKRKKSDLNKFVQGGQLY